MSTKAYKESSPKIEVWYEKIFESIINSFMCFISFRIYVCTFFAKKGDINKFSKKKKSYYRRVILDIQVNKFNLRTSAVKMAGRVRPFSITVPPKMSINENFS